MVTHVIIIYSKHSRAALSRQPNPIPMAQPELQMVAETQPSNAPHIMYVQYYVDRTKTQSIHLL